MCHTLLRTLALAAFLTACQSNPAQTVTPSPAQTSPTQLSPTQTSPAAAQPPSNTPALDHTAVQKLICGATTPCILTDLQPAKDPAGTLHIAEVAFIADAATNPRWKEAKVDDPGNCNPWSLFLVDASKTPLSATKVADFCNDGYGAAFLGEDRWEVQDGRLSVTIVGGSNWRWGETKILDLKTLQVIAKNTDGYWAPFHQIFEEHTWDFQKFAGKSTWSVLVCETEETTLENQSVIIPSLTLPPDFVGSTWKTTSLGSCAATLDSSAKHGFVVHGQPALDGSNDATMKIIASDDGHLFVEILDDQLRASTTGKWIHADHLELWVSPNYLPRMQHECVNPEDKTGTWQWGIDALDGTVHTAFGKPPHALHAERVAIPGGVRFKVKLPPDTRSLAVIYSDSDDGQSQERLLATSTFKFARLHTMASLTPFDAKNITCTTEGGALKAHVPPMSDVLGMAP